MKTDWLNKTAFAPDLETSFDSLEGKGSDKTTLTACNLVVSVLSVA